MIPVNNIENTDNSDFELVTAASKTFRINIEKNKIESRLDGLKAVEQAIYKILMTQRYKYVIYSWNYGIEINDVLGKPKSYAKSVLPSRIEDALKPDDRILYTHDFSFADIDKTTLAVSFTADTIYGELPVKWEVNFNV